MNKNASQWNAYRPLVSPSMHCSGGAACPGGCTYPGVYLPGGVPAKGCTCLGCTCQGVYLPGEMYLPGSVPAKGGVPARGGTCPGAPPLWTDRHV